MSNYKIGLLVFSNSTSQGAKVFKLFEKSIMTEDFGVIKSVEMYAREPALIAPAVDAYKNTNLGVIILVAPEADNFFPYAELEEVGQKNEKYLVTLNLDEKVEENFLEMIKKVKASPGMRRRGCDSSCR